MFEFLSFFTTTGSKDFKNQLSKFKALMDKEGLKEEEVLIKKSYEQICSLSTENSNFKYSELSNTLDVSPINSLKSLFRFPKVILKNGPLKQLQMVSLMLRLIS